MSWKILLAPLFLIVCSCSTIKSGRLYEENTSKVFLENNSADIKIIDLRDNVDSKNEINIPIISNPGDKIVHNRKFNDDVLISLFKNELSLGSGLQNSITIDVTILKAIQRFQANWVKEFEEVVAELEVKINLEKTKCSSTEEVIGVVESADASTEYSDDMLKSALAKSFNLALVKCLAKIKNN